jgi:hypothetical protein
LPKGGVLGHFTINRVFGAGKAILFRPNTGNACDSRKVLRPSEAKVRELIDWHKKIQELFHFIARVWRLRNILAGGRAKYVGYGDMDGILPDCACSELGEWVLQATTALDEQQKTKAYSSW